MRNTVLAVTAGMTLALMGCADDPDLPRVGTPAVAVIAQSLPPARVVAVVEARGWLRRLTALQPLEPARVAAPPAPALVAMAVPAAAPASAPPARPVAVRPPAELTPRPAIVLQASAPPPRVVPVQQFTTWKSACRSGDVTACIMADAMEGRPVSR